MVAYQQKTLDNEKLLIFSQLRLSFCTAFKVLLQSWVINRFALTLQHFEVLKGLDGKSSLTHYVSNSAAALKKWKAVIFFAMVFTWSFRVSYCQLPACA